MKKFFLTLGVIFLVLLVLGAIGFGYVAFRGNALDKESKTYANAAISANFTTWNKAELSNRASPEFRQSVTDEQLDRTWHVISTLGRLLTFDSAEGQSLTSVSSQTGKIITADYQARAAFEKGDATIKLKLIKHGDQWQILGVNVLSPKFAGK